MARKTSTLEIKILGDASSATKAMGEAEGRMGGLSSKLGALGGVAAAGVAVGVGALAAFGKASFDAASDLEQSTGAINSVFGDWAVDIEQSAQAAADSVGLSTSAYENLASVLGAQLKGAGMNIGDVTGKTQDLVKMGADLAATFGGSTSDAVEALSSVLKGETDPIEKYGISIKQSDINARLAAQGQDKLTGTALKTATANAALALVTGQSKDAMGAFGRESDTAAGAGARLSAKFDNLKATVGEKLLPVFTKIANYVTDKVFPFLEKLAKKYGPAVSEAFKKIGEFITEKAVPAFKKVWEFVQTYVIPIFEKTLKPALSKVKDVFKEVADKVSDNSDKFKKLYDKVKPLLEFLRDHVAPLVGGALKTGFETLGTVIGTVVDALGWVVDKLSWLLDHGAAAAKWVGGLFGSAAPAVPAGGGGMFGAGMFGAAPGLRAGAMFSAGGGTAGPGSTASGLFAVGDTYNITITGALDPVAVGRQVESVLAKYRAATGRTVALTR